MAHGTAELGGRAGGQLRSGRARAAAAMRIATGNGRRPLRFVDRVDAGRRLASALIDHVDADSVVVGLPRGGVVVAYEVAETLQLPLDVIVVRKLGAPLQRELAVGAVAERSVRVVNGAIQRLAGMSDEEVEDAARRELEEVERRASLYREGRVPISLAQKTVIVVDDGVATGATCQAACESARRADATRVVVALPVGAAESISDLATRADSIVCLETPAGFSSVGEWYVNFGQTSDAEVVALLARAAERGEKGNE
ncbi:MAG: phosphoribosyltransferase family protein [Acidimicrobiales bacterium]